MHIPGLSVNTKARPDITTEVNLTYLNSILKATPRRHLRHRKLSFVQYMMIYLAVNARGGALGVDLHDTVAEKT